MVTMVNVVDITDMVDMVDTVDTVYISIRHMKQNVTNTAPYSKIL